MVKYLLDTNSFITPYRSYYNPQITPPFWNNLLSLFEKCHLYTIDKVVEEIKKGRDWLTDWIKKLPKNKVLKPEEDISIMQKYEEIVRYLETTDYRKKDEFINCDAYLITYVLTYDYVLVTFEKLDSSKIIKIPKVCNALGIPVSPLLYENRYLNLPTLSLEEIQNYKCISLFEMMIKLDLKP